jgi:hypothetical protein
MGQKTFKELFEAARRRPEYKVAMKKLEAAEAKMKEGKGKVWIFRETGQKVYGCSGKWMNVNGHPEIRSDDSMMYRKYPELSMESFDSDPLEPIREVYDTWRKLNADEANESTIRVGFGLLRDAIKKAVGEK